MGCQTQAAERLKEALHCRTVKFERLRDLGGGASGRIEPRKDIEFHGRKNHF